VQNNPETEAQKSYMHDACSLHVLSFNAACAYGVTPFGFCLRVIVHEKPLNLEKTTYSVLSVMLLIYAKVKKKNDRIVNSFCLQKFQILVYYFQR